MRAVLHGRLYGYLTFFNPDSMLSCYDSMGNADAENKCFHNKDILSNFSGHEEEFLSMAVAGLS